VGHAVEALSGYELLHGEAVAIGMVAEARIAERTGVAGKGTAERLRRLLGRIGLPTSVPIEWNVDEVIALTRTDKKARAGRVEYSLISGPGVPAQGIEGRYGFAVPDEVVREVLGVAVRA
jgi:3-dehydroquinate synthase